MNRHIGPGEFGLGDPKWLSTLAVLNQHTNEYTVVQVSQTPVDCMLCSRVIPSGEPFLVEHGICLSGIAFCAECAVKTAEDEVNYFPDGADL